MKQFSTILQQLANYDHIIWDWNGTILNDLDTAVLAVNSVLKDYDLESISKETYLKEFGFPVSSFYQSIGMDTKKLSMDKLSEKFHQHYENNIHTASIFTGMHVLLSELKKQNKKLYVLSAGAQWLLDNWVKSYEVEAYFERIFGLSDLNASSKVERGKELMQDQKLLASDKIIMIGDTLHDHEVSNALSIDSLLIAEGHQSFGKLQQADCMVLPTRYG